VADLKANRKTTTKAAALKKAPAKKAASTALRIKSGAVLTPEAEAALLAEAESGYDPDKLVPRKAAGRPSLSPTGGTSHRINVRVDDEIYDVLQRVASDSGRSPSELVREVLRAAYGPRP
jgi:hypothetical protein